ncbi:MAG: hypothetical protein ACKODX_06430 [Gemmata sp.]
MIRSTFFSALAAAGCAPHQPSEPPAAAPAVVVAADASAAAPVRAEPQGQPPARPPAPPPTFPFAPDLTGQALPRVVAPAMPLKLADGAPAAPQPRSVPAKFLDPQPPAARPAHALPPLPSPKPVAGPPAAPSEKVPLALGVGAGELPARRVLPVAAVETPRARDVSLPPPAPTLGRPASDRVPFDDPTSEVGNAAVVASPAKVPLGVSGFLKVPVPDPFELAEQVRPGVPPAAEPSAAPIVVNPLRAK